MRHILPTIALIVILSAAGRAWSWTIQDGGKTSGDQQPSPTDAGDKPDLAPQDQVPNEPWRFKRHQGLWWYWQPSESWVYWWGDRWVAYDPEAYAQFQAARRTRSDSSSKGSSWGALGPIRYNGYGQVEYPYSRRTRGIKQLGPVPAMGGVRSLPGWGGER